MEPLLQHEKRPDLLVVIVPVRQVFVQQPCYVRFIEQALPAKVRTDKELQNLFLELIAYKRRDRSGEAHLLSLRNFRGKDSSSDPTQDRFGLAASHFYRILQRIELLDEIGGEKWRAQLDRMQHRRAVRVGQHVVGQVLLLVEVGDRAER